MGNEKTWQETEAENKATILKDYPFIKDESGIYAFVRTDQAGIRHAYVGQAKKVLTRLAQHLAGYEQYIDLSLRKYGLYSLKNPYGWTITYKAFPTSSLDNQERYYIKLFANSGHQMKNKLSGGQDGGRVAIAEQKPTKTYREGIEAGYRKAQKEVAKLFEVNLAYSINGAENERKKKALKKFEDFIMKGEKE